MTSFSLFSFSYPQTLRESLLSSPAASARERIGLLRSRCKEVLLAEGSKHTDQIKTLILDAKTDGYLVLYCDCGDGFIFSSSEKIVETLLCQKESSRSGSGSSDMSSAASEGHSSRADSCLKSRASSRARAAAKKRVIFRIFSGRQLQLPEILFYLVHKGLDINGIVPHGRPPDSGTPHSNTRFVY